uniref:Non-homologous end-joining factor 1 n=1 Tax=Monopterus albus TaxID=43700 RepID=A0A3Q3Q884_MONAL|nr:non-homologous end-joining factor 1 [Monopterus albus]XP_020447709.1 non-homologous end-joining factor 1 [Monopterus albus]XP_020447710.1 non-homologous end-joining factor 1 [Monopterus albus]
MMEASGAPADILLQCPWLPVNINGFQLLAKSWFGDAAYHILLTDMSSVWEERMDSAAIQSRAQELNRRLRASVKAFFSHLCEVVRPSLSGERADSEAQISLTRQDGGDISMRLKSKLAGLPVYWEFHCTPAPVTLVCEQLARPLLVMSRLLQRQVEQLGAMLGRKDAEIQDYRENGATLSRERLQTDVFEEHTYREDFLAKALPQLCYEQEDTLGFNPDLQHLYTAVVTHRSTRKRKLSEERFVEEEHTAPEVPEPSPSPGAASVGSKPAEKEREQNSKMDVPTAKMADRAAAQQSLSVTSKHTERPPSKPKKKKGVGLFR